MKSALKICSVIILLLVLSQSALAWSPPSYWVSTNTWSELFNLKTDTTYTYDLRAYHGRLRFQGTLNISLPKYGEDIEFWYDIDGVQGSGSAPQDPRALVGALTLSLLSVPKADMDMLKLLLAPFQFVNWFEYFSGATFRVGTVWKVNYSPPVSFEVTRRSGLGSNRQYEGAIYSGRNVLMELTIDLTQPLPVTVGVYSEIGNWQYVAELRESNNSPILLR